MKEAFIVDAVRTACGKANKGSLRFIYPDTMGAEVVKDLMSRNPKLDGEHVDDVIMGCAFPEASQGLNISRNIAMLAGLPDSVPGMTVNRFCSSGLQTIAIAAERIMVGAADVVIAGGVESMSMVPMGGMSVQPNPGVIDTRPEVYISMGLTAENLAEKYKISRGEQDEFAYQSHKKAINAWETNRFGKQITPIAIKQKKVSANGELIEDEFTFAKDEGPRANTSTEALGGLNPVFKMGGSVTAGNSSQMNDAASAVIVMSGEKIKELGLTPIARYVGFDVAGVAPEYMGIGPVEAIPRLLKRIGMNQNEIEQIELNEAFAAQSLSVIKELDLNPEIINLNGGAIAMGHPLGCTGAKLTTQLLYEMQERKQKYGMVTMCIGGGMG
ncbi:MAG: thiolase family protein, partial [Balneolales bacterium]|nr:thiolase family protein [Balneolales bacterium]